VCLASRLLTLLVKANTIIVAAAGTDTAACCVREANGYCVAAVTQADCDAADACLWKSNRCTARYQATQAHLAGGTSPKEFMCSMAVSKGFCDNIGKLGAACQWFSGLCRGSSMTIPSCGRNRNSQQCTSETHRPSNGIPACVWDHQACMNQCGSDTVHPMQHGSSWPGCLLPTCNSMTNEPSVAVCTACSGSAADECTAASCSAGYYPYDASTHKCTQIQEPPAPSDPKREVVKRVQMKLDVDIVTITVGTPARVKFEADFSRDVAARLSIEAQRIVINSIAPGSIVVDFSIRPDSSGTPVPTAAITTAFSTPGIAIAGAQTTSAITAASVAAELVLKPPSSGGGVPLQPPSPPPSLQASNEPSSDIHWAAIFLPIVGALLLLLMLICFAPGEACERCRKQIGIRHVAATQSEPRSTSADAPTGRYVDFNRVAGNDRPAKLDSVHITLIPAPAPAALAEPAPAPAAPTPTAALTTGFVRQDESGTLRDPPALSRTQVAHQVAAKSPPVKPTRPPPPVPGDAAPVTNQAKKVNK
jgi:hypothetical protein